MAESAPKVIHYTDEEADKLQKDTSEKLRQMGYKVDPQSINPQEESIPHQVEHKARDFLRVAGQTLEGSSYMPDTPSKEPLSILAKKKSKMARIVDKFIGKKAA